VVPLSTSLKIKEQAQLFFESGLSLLQQGKLDEADIFFLKVIRLDSNHAEAFNLLGISAYQKLDYRKAVDHLNTANSLAPNSAYTLNNLGLVHNALSEFNEALSFLNLALTCDLTIPEIHNNRGNALKGLNKNQEAQKAYMAAIALRPNYCEALNNQGVILLEEGKIDESIRIFDKVIEINPTFSIALNSLGNAFTQLRMFHKAYQYFEQALKINPSYLEACLNFGGSLKKNKQFYAAIDCYQHALKINPLHAKTFYLLGEIYYDMGDCELAKTYYAKSLEINPSNLEAHFGLAIAQIPKIYKNQDGIGASRQLFTQGLKFLEIFEARETTPISTFSANTLGRHPFYLAYQDADNKNLLMQYGQLSVKLAHTAQEQISTSKIQNDSKEKYRIGIVSNYFYDHPVWQAITKGWVSHLNGDIFDIYLFNTNGIEDSESQQAKSKVAHYINCGSLPSKAAQLIANENMDILLYPEIGMDSTSKALACLRLAPTQAASWGHPETTGLQTIDFYLSSNLFETSNADSFYSEQLIKLPNLGSYVEYESVEVTLPNLETLGIDQNLPILICAGSPSKYSPSYDMVLVEIAKNLGECQFIFFNFDEILTPILKERLTEAFNQARLNANDYIRFIPFLNKNEFHGLMQAATLYLDSIGFSGFNTAIQAVMCNLPIVTIQGNWMRSRLASGILERLGLENFICKTNEGYINFVVKLIHNPELLETYKSTLQKNKTVLFNDMEPIHALEDFLMQQAKKQSPHIR